MVRPLVVLFFLLGFLVPGTPAHAALDGADPQCRRESVPVHLSATDATVYQLAGWACGVGAPAGRPVEVLVPGFTYAHAYWDFPFTPQVYSYVRAATDAHNITFAVDRLGTGQSSYPPSALLTASAHVYALHQ